MFKKGYLGSFLTQLLIDLIREKQEAKRRKEMEKKDKEMFEEEKVSIK